MDERDPASRFCSFQLAYLGSSGAKATSSSEIFEMPRLIAVGWLVHVRTTLVLGKKIKTRGQMC